MCFCSVPKENSSSLRLALLLAVSRERGSSYLHVFSPEEGLSGRAGCRSPSCHDLHCSYFVGRAVEFSIQVSSSLCSGADLHPQLTPLPSCLALSSGVFVDMHTGNNSRLLGSKNIYLLPCNASTCQVIFR